MERLRKLFIAMNERQPLFGPTYDNFGYGQRIISVSESSSSGMTSSGFGSVDSQGSGGSGSPFLDFYDPWAYNAEKVDEDHLDQQEDWIMGNREFVSYHRKLEDNKFPYSKQAMTSKPWKEFFDASSEIESSSSDFSLDLECDRIEAKTDIDFQQFTPERTSTPVQLSSLVEELNKCFVSSQIEGKKQLKLKTRNLKQKRPKPKKRRLNAVKENSQCGEQQFCEYCKSIGKVKSVYKSHTLMDKKGRCLCPALRVQECVICGADGDEAHVVENCPLVKNNGSNFKFLSGPAVSHENAARRLDFMKF